MAQQTEPIFPAQPEPFLEPWARPEAPRVKPATECATCEKPHDSRYYFTTAEGVRTFQCYGCAVIWQDAKKYCRLCNTRCNFAVEKLCFVCQRKPADRAKGLFRECQSADFRVPEHIPFQGNPPDGIYFGIELEIATESQNDIAVSLFGDIGPYCVHKSDGSVPGGVEIVTTACSLDIHREKIPKLLASETWTKNQAYESESCGLHVHVSRKPLSALQVGKILAFIHSAQNRPFIRKVAGRADCRYARYEYDQKIINAVKNKPDGKDTALHLGRTETIEFRLFASSLKTEVVLARLDFVAAIIAFTRPGSHSCMDAISAGKFQAWLPKKDYPFLHAYLNYEQPRDKNGRFVGGELSPANVSQHTAGNGFGSRGVGRAEFTVDGTSIGSVAARAIASNGERRQSSGASANGQTRIFLNEERTRRFWSIPH